MKIAISYCDYLSTPLPNIDKSKPDGISVDKKPVFVPAATKTASCNLWCL
ncbi:MAG: hypothetical protein LBK55_10640 [Azoarcus sp.]|jgi:hypothetical protein|nr:hypothetical protein [Azoarcus sp.]